MVSTFATVLATLYASFSCRFLVLQFESESGGFEEYFGNAQEAEAGRNERTVYKAGIGLFSWLRPQNAYNFDNWESGTCAGYLESMLPELHDIHFDAARLASVVAVLCSVFMLLWTFIVMPCFELNRMQLFVFALVSFIGAASTAVTFLLQRSGLCHELFLERECKWDSGALVMMAGALLWLTTFVMAVMFLRPEPFKALRQQSPDYYDNRKLSKEEKNSLEREIMRRKRRQDKQKMLAEVQAEGKAVSPYTPKTRSSTGPSPRSATSPSSINPCRGAPSVSSVDHAISPSALSGQRASSPAVSAKGQSTARAIAPQFQPSLNHCSKSRSLSRPSSPSTKDSIVATRSLSSSQPTHRVQQQRSGQEAMPNAIAAPATRPVSPASFNYESPRGTNIRPNINSESVRLAQDAQRMSLGQRVSSLMSNRSSDGSRSENIDEKIRLEILRRKAEAARLRGEGAKPSQARAIAPAQGRHPSRPTKADSNELDEYMEIVYMGK